MNPSLWFFSPRKGIYGVGVEVGGALGGPRGRGRALGVQARLPPSWIGCGPLALILSPVFFIISKNNLHEVSGHSENFYFCTKITPWQLLKTASVRVSSIQIMQVRVQNKGKSVWKIRYDGDVSVVIINHPPSPLSWCSQPGVSNSFIGLAGWWWVGWDLSCNQFC